MFRGRYEHSVDAKGRIALPVRFREELDRLYEDERLIITAHLTDPCLVIYPLKEWEAFEERLSKLPQLDPKVTMLRRMYVGRAHECALDKQGRLLVSPELRRDAGIDRDAVWSGSARYLELWSKPTYEAHLDQVQKKLVGGELGEAIEKLAELGI
ncbi:MAG: division/cell wall cluster transcriptional repressor MraZ [Deltaproteobacteria bacterium]|nr:division/cell wall cluster transcriptional repressor MraZ [Deltaproteobacteria bacterium]